MKKIIYMDNAATTPVHEAVTQIMMPYFTVNYGNASGSYEMARRARRDIENARAVIANTIGARPEEIYFTSGGTESDNWAVKAVAYEHGRGNIVSTNIEHKAMLNSLEWIESHGIKVKLAEADADGVITAEKIGRCIDDDTVMVSVMAANNETGTIMPLRNIAISNRLREKKILFHTDAVQAYGHIYINVNECALDMLSASAHKFRGPKGIGFMYVRRNSMETSLIHGGSQEMGLRAGTENTALIVGMAKAAQIAMDTLNMRRSKETAVRDYFINKIMGAFDNARLNGSHANRLSNNINVCFAGTNAYKLVLALDRYGVCASAGSACSSASSKPSHVLKAIGLTDDDARASVRFSISEETTYRDVDYVIECLKRLITDESLYID